MIRCAVYTRKSSEEGLEQEFNSLEAQREACTAYIASQRGEGWHLLKSRYDDGGFSGGNMQRPALRRLLGDIEAGRVDVVVVYKVDRLTRSLSDFVRIIEKFDQYNVSFVSVTQQFNTTSSMGRLTLNVLLSFAQFEREVTSERIRDKIAASKRKGMWMGGIVPLGYDLKNHKLIVNAKEAKTVHYMYHRYLELGCVRLLKEDLDRQGIVSKVRRDGRGSPFSRGVLYKMLSNPIYIGQIRHKGSCHPGQHEAIIDRQLWDEVQQHRQINSHEHKSRCRFNSPLAGKLFDISGERLISVHVNKKGRRYRYYISESLKADPRDASQTAWRLPGQEIEKLITSTVLEIIHDDVALTNALRESAIPAHGIASALVAAKKVKPEPADIIGRFVERVELSNDGMRLTLSLASLVSVTMASKALSITRDFPLKMKRRGIEMRLIIGGKQPTEVDNTLVKTIVRAHKWFNDLADGSVNTLGEIAQREGIDKGYVSRVIQLAFLSPRIIESIIGGRQPADLRAEKITRKIDLPYEWDQQHKLLGLS